MPPVLIALFTVAAAAIILTNVLASVRISRDDIGTPQQRVAQFLFVWLVPIVGAIFVILLTRKNLEPGLGEYGEAREQQDENLAVARRDYDPD